MFVVSLATLGIARNSRSSRTIRSSFACRYSRTALAISLGLVPLSLFCANPGIGARRHTAITSFFTYALPTSIKTESAIVANLFGIRRAVLIFLLGPACSIVQVGCALSANDSLAKV